MSKMFRSLFIAGLFTPLILVTACAPKDHSQQNNGSEPKDASQEVVAQLQQPSKTFPSTPNDAHDIQLLEEYDQKLSENNHAIEADLRQRAEQGSLTDEVTKQLKRDGIQSSLNMLKQLDLKTEQGRYIQGLLSQYWENQAKAMQENQPSAEAKTPQDAPQTMSELSIAQKQLDFWKATTTG